MSFYCAKDGERLACVDSRTRNFQGKSAVIRNYRCPGCGTECKSVEHIFELTPGSVAAEAKAKRRLSADTARRRFEYLSPEGVWLPTSYRAFQLSVTERNYIRAGNILNKAGTKIRRRQEET